MVNRRRQHIPDSVTQENGPPHWVTDITVIPAAPATPTSPSPPRTGAMPARPRPPDVAPPRKIELPILAEVSIAKPPGPKVTIGIVLKRYKMCPDNQIVTEPNLTLLGSSLKEFDFKIILLSAEISPPGQLLLQVVKTGLIPQVGVVQHKKLSGSNCSCPLSP